MPDVFYFILIKKSDARCFLFYIDKKMMPCIFKKTSEKYGENKLKYALNMKISFHIEKWQNKQNRHF